MSRRRPITNIDDPRYVRALAHPLRVRILAILEERVASPAQIAPLFDASLGVVSYHVRTLERLGLIEQVGQRQVRGATQHFYRALERPRISDEAWGEATPIVKQAMIGATIEQIHQYVTNSAGAGGFDRGDAHITRTALRLDAKGWEQLARLCRKLLEDVAKIEEGVARRQKRAGVPEEDLESVGLVLMMFEALRFSDAAPDVVPARRSRAARGSSSRSAAARAT